ncbi:hypothetical protein E6P09_01885 [Haloferax mediterranei ATCC 33500]|uniref:Uncharacterized protein n=1 Tax=Haloferax mediterranei (strain ATCC 33500 / DSM 1411 / JCM 8866 / NBRC 14739 / NCIMB 2177 / R-4) TaxID=523841 RepID=A0A4P8P8M2_HALMT|nr:hypothetical protein [Haloferax mediterranei]MDX5987601.1 hypothetical protein [Haloferax mediterranei ATCC 33500]QCQ74089.1 hypothetical protein E6P09_01885 [Haloferax mediterranei ATCC 33500]
MLIVFTPITVPVYQLLSTMSVGVLWETLIQWGICGGLVLLRRKLPLPRPAQSVSIYSARCEAESSTESLVLWNMSRGPVVIGFLLWLPLFIAIQNLTEAIYGIELDATAHSGFFYGFGIGFLGLCVWISDRYVSQYCVLPEYGDRLLDEETDEKEE